MPTLIWHHEDNLLKKKSNRWTRKKIKDDDMGYYCCNVKKKKSSSRSQDQECSTLTNEINHSQKWGQLRTIKVNGGYELQLMFGN